MEPNIQQEGMRHAITSNDTIHPMRESAWIILNKVIPSLHDKRTTFSPDKVYVAVYTALGLEDKVLR